MALLQFNPDGTRAVIPLATQEELHNAPDDIKDILFGGAIGGGKTDGLISLPIRRRFFEIPDTQAVILRPSVPQLEGEILPRTRSLYPHFGGKFNEQKKIWTFPSGYRVMCGYAETPKDIEKYDGVQFHLVMFDELQKFDKATVDYLMVQRLRAAPGIPTIGRHTGMPGGKGHAWVVERYGLEKFPKGRMILEQKLRKDSDRVHRVMFIPSRLEDNKHLDESYTSQLDGLDEGLFEARRYGNWASMSGDVFRNFRVEHRPGEPDNALHVYEPFRIPDHWTRFIAIDPGHAAYTFAIWCAIDPKTKVLWIYRTYARKGLTTTEWAIELKIMNAGDPIKFVVIDSAAFSNKGEKSTVAAQFKEEFGLFPRRSVKDRISGKQAILELLRWKPKPVDRLDEFDPDECWRIYQEQGRAAAMKYEYEHVKPEEEQNLPRMRIMSRSPEGLPTKNLTDVIRTRERDDKNIEDVLETLDDDGYDCLRYACNAFFDWLNSRLDAKQKKRSKVLDKLPRTDDDFRHLNHQALLHKEVRNEILGKGRKRKIKVRARANRRKRVEPKWLKPWKSKSDELLDRIRPD